MKKTIQNMTFTVVILAMTTGTLLAQEQPPLPETSDNFRINVVVDRNGPVAENRLNLMLELLNNSPEDVILTAPSQPAPIETQAFPDEPVDGDSNMPPIIGTARLVPLRLPPPEENAQQPEIDFQEAAPVEKQIPLRLLSNPVIPGHSTVVISIASMPLSQEPADALNQENVSENNDEPMGLRPGLYLLDCKITAIEGVAEMHAETIIAIPPQLRHDNGRRPNQIQEPQQRRDNGRRPNQAQEPQQRRNNGRRQNQTHRPQR